MRQEQGLDRISTVVSLRQESASSTQTHVYANAAPHLGMSAADTTERRGSTPADPRPAAQATTATTPLPITHAFDDSDATYDAWFAFLRAHESVPVRRVLYTTVLKRGLDIVGSLFALILCLPLLLLVAALIKIGQGGPVFYRQQRTGRYGAPFTMYKFTSMIPDRRNQAVPWDGVERRKSHKTRTDPRVTRVGRIIRALSIDELPQLFNILRGDMSLIGPRPELPVIVARYQPWQHQRHLLRPGLTGWWQVEGRSDRPMHEHTDLDLYYIEHVSFTLDLRILVRTFKAVLSRSGAF